MQVIIQRKGADGREARILAAALMAAPGEIEGILNRALTGWDQPIQHISHQHIVNWATCDSRVENFSVRQALDDEAWTPQFIHETGLTFEVWKNQWANYQGRAQSAAYLAILEERQEALKKRSITQDTASHHGKTLLLVLSIIIAIGAYASCRDLL